MPSVSLNLLLIHKPTFNAQLFILQGFFFGMVCHLQYIKLFAGRKAPWISG